MKKTNFCANLHAVGDLRYEECAYPTAKEDEVSVAIRACGVCGSDLGRVYKSGTYHFPTVIGHEFSGVVVEDAKGEFLGKRVAVFPVKSKITPPVTATIITARAATGGCLVFLPSNALTCSLCPMAFLTRKALCASLRRWRVTPF